MTRPFSPYFVVLVPLLKIICPLHKSLFLGTVFSSSGLHVCLYASITLAYYSFLKFDTRTYMRIPTLLFLLNTILVISVSGDVICILSSEQTWSSEVTDTRSEPLSLSAEATVGPFTRRGTPAFQKWIPIVINFLWSTSVFP